jgi:hypothetical protein
MQRDLECSRDPEQVHAVTADSNNVELDQKGVSAAIDDLPVPFRLDEGDPHRPTSRTTERTIHGDLPRPIHN